jgi:hypothetical protein
MHRYALAALLLSATFLAGCGLPSLILSEPGSRATVTREFDFSDFDRVEAGNAFRVEIMPGDDYRVVVTVNENFEPYLRARQRGDTVVLQMAQGRNYQNSDFRAEITMPELVGLNLSGASTGQVGGFRTQEPFDLQLSGASSLRGDLEVGDARINVSGASTVRSGLRADDVRVEVSGASRVALQGAGTTLWVEASGASRADLSELAISGNARVEASGASTVDVLVDGRLDANASGASRVRYGGDATLGDVEESGGSRIQRQ